MSMPATLASLHLIGCHRNRELLPEVPMEANNTSKPHIWCFGPRS